MASVMSEAVIGSGVDGVGGGMSWVGVEGIVMEEGCGSVGCVGGMAMVVCDVVQNEEREILRFGEGGCEGGGGV